jgi:hypothetical protein
VLGEDSRDAEIDSCGAAKQSEDGLSAKSSVIAHLCLPREPFSPLQLSFADSAAPAAIILSVPIIQRGMLR